MEWWEILVGILLFIVALSVLVGIHELGHLAAAKLFNVYCFDYSIGFGPKIIGTKRDERHETTWTLRAIPLGGFVSMYGEGTPNTTDQYIPESRSLEGIAHYKRAIIMAAGVFLNFILGFVLILISNGAFDHISYYSYYHRDTNSYQSGISCSISDSCEYGSISDGDEIKVFNDAFTAEMMVAKDITINGSSTQYVLCLASPTTTKYDQTLSELFRLYPEKSLDARIDTALAKGISDQGYINLLKANNISWTNEKATNELKKIKADGTFKARYKTEMNTYYTNHGFDTSIDNSAAYKVTSTFTPTNAVVYFYTRGTNAKYSITLSLKGSNKGFADTGINLKRYINRYDAATTFKTTWDQWCGANSAIFVGLGQLFSGQNQQLSGFIGIAKVSTSVLSDFGFGQFIYLWGVISCNLAIMNLIPFPGLDGWQLVVVAYEAIRKKPIPIEVKGIISYVGLGLLFVLMIFVTIKDVIGLF